MSDSTYPAARSRLIPMRPRNPREPFRTASSLELFFDLVFVVAVSVASAQLHHALTQGHVTGGLGSYAFVFFGIWWAWMNFTWFATSFDTDDWLYRVLTIVQMGGVLVLAAGIEPAFTDSDYDWLVYGYVVMRVAMSTQWLRASRGAGQARRTPQVYAVGIIVVQLLWVAWLAVPRSFTTAGLVVLIAAELAVPVAAEQREGTTWHPHHITERYGLFTLIVLGESLLGSANAIIKALHDHESVGPLVSLSVLALVVTAALWWIYFWPPHHRAIGNLGQSLRYGYTHYFVFAAAGALSAGIEVEIDIASHHSALSETGGAFAFAIPVAIFLVGIWWIAIREQADRVVNTAIPLGAVLVLADPVLPIPVAISAAILAGVVIVLVLRRPVQRSGDQDCDVAPAN